MLMFLRIDSIDSFELIENISLKSSWFRKAQPLQGSQPKETIDTLFVHLIRFECAKKCVCPTCYVLVEKQFRVEVEKVSAVSPQPLLDVHYRPLVDWLGSWLI